MDHATASAVQAAIGRATTHAPFLRQLVSQHADIAELLHEGRIDAALAAASIVEAPDVAATLRRQRARLALVVAIADLANLWPLERVTGELSAFADRALDIAIGEALRLHTGATDVVGSGLAVIALGKHGSRELNYSSDIDPIFLYDPVTLPRRAREDPGEAAVRIVRRVVDLLQTRDGDGYVFRVDLRLRPAVEATPIALPVDAAIGHYESSALAWERAAFIRARAAAGDRALGDRFLHTIAPFVWRRSLDFGAVGELQTLTRSIREHHGATVFGPGFDLKRGRGGIREVEFFAQIHQLIHGGRDAGLRISATLAALAALAEAGRIAPDDACVLGNAYRRFRTVEHRLQMIDDRQTHNLPEDPAALAAVAALDGLGDAGMLLANLAPQVTRVGVLYDSLDTGGDMPGATVDLSPFTDAAAAASRIARWRGGSVRAVRSTAAIAAFETLLPDIIGDIGRASDPDAALARLDQLLGRLSSGINLFRLLDAQPAVRALLIEILSHAPTLAEALALRPALIDRLLDQTALDAAPDNAVLRAEMTHGGDTEAMLDRVRQTVGEHRFALGVQTVAGTSDPIDVASGYARIAEAAIDVVAARIIDDFAERHGRVPGSEFVILALGRLGGGLLTHASDLDLIYLFTGDFATESDGQRPLGAALYYNRLAQRITAALSVPTSVGSLYDVDTRLRPSGAQGPLVVSVDSFARYQREAAWTWEHMALTRARAVFGSPSARASVDAVILKTLTQPRDQALLRTDVVAMRRDIAVHKPPAGAFDIKLGSGGHVELEFVVHFNQLRHATALSPDLRSAINALAAAGKVTAELRVAHDLLTRLLVTLRLVSPELDIPAPASRAVVARACQQPDWPTLVAQTAAARQCIAGEWARIVDGEH